jgi:hypothetical protein
MMETNHNNDTKPKAGRPKGTWGKVVRVSVPTGVLPDVLELIRQFKEGVKNGK